MKQLALARTIFWAMMVALLGWTQPAMANLTTCGVTGNATATPVLYDPFDPQPFSQANITMNLVRVNTSGGGDTRIVNMYLKASPLLGTGADGTQIIPTGVVGSTQAEGTGQNIFYNYNASPPTVLPVNTPAVGNGFLKIDFTGNNTGSDTAQVNFTVNLPANLNINAIENLTFDAFFSCEIRGGKGNNLEQSGSFSDAVVFPVTVLSALQASFVGTALDFGEIGDVDNAAAPARNTGIMNYVRVQSSGAYNVTLASQNAFRVKHPTGNLANPLDRVAYKLKFLGLEKDNVSDPGVNAISYNVNCARAGIGAANEDRLYMLATLQEGGQGKTPSLGGTYQDILTVTVTPLAYSAVFPTDCNAFTVP